jgi:tripartite-type tricarboxylate transporter receptor subunit TctC
MTSQHYRLLALGIVAGACLSQAKADVVAEFYKGRTVTVVVSSNAAGGYDTFARAIARYMGKHIPGNPALIVRNMPGAGGMTATNFLYNNADKDGSVIGLVQNNTPFEPLFGTKEARYDPVRFNWLGSPSAETAMVLLWHAAPVNSVADLKAREVAVGVSGANSTPAFFTHQWLSRAERCAPRYGTARDRRPSQRVFQLGALDASQLAPRQDCKGHRAIWSGEARRASRCAVCSRSRDK